MSDPLIKERYNGICLLAGNSADKVDGRMDCNAEN